MLGKILAQVPKWLLGKTTYVRSNLNGFRVVQGTLAPQPIPWQVAHINNFDYINCGGTILREDLILTAAHCYPEIGDIIIAGLLGVSDYDNAQARLRRIIMVASSMTKISFF